MRQSGAKLMVPPWTAPRTFIGDGQPSRRTLWGNARTSSSAAAATPRVRLCGATPIRRCIQRHKSRWKWSAKNDKDTPRTISHKKGHHLHKSAPHITDKLQDARCVPRLKRERQKRRKLPENVYSFVIKYDPYIHKNLWIIFGFVQRIFAFALVDCRA